MSEFLLTDEEIDEEWPREVVYVGNLELEVQRCSRLVAKAQLKKVAKVINGVFSEAKWQTLLKEIE